MKRLLPTVIVLADLCPVTSHAFCGFYVASGDAKLFNKASQVALVRDGDRTVLTMANDFRGEPKQFAIVVPVPTVLEKSQIHIADKALIDHLDAFSAPRLVEYWDPDPCQIAREERFLLQNAAPSAKMSADLSGVRGHSLRVTIESRYTVG